jgi:hypothetical protein
MIGHHLRKLGDLALEAEMSEHLGYDKRLRCRAMSMPRSSRRSCGRQRRLTGVDQIVLSLTAKGLTTGEIAEWANRPPDSQSVQRQPWILLARLIHQNEPHAPATSADTSSVPAWSSSSRGIRPSTEPGAVKMPDRVPRRPLGEIPVIARLVWPAGEEWRPVLANRWTRTTSWSPL